MNHGSHKKSTVCTFLACSFRWYTQYSSFLFQHRGRNITLLHIRFVTLWGLLHFHVCHIIGFFILWCLSHYDNCCITVWCLSPIMTFVASMICHSIYSAVPTNLQPLISSFSDVCSSGKMMPQRQWGSNISSRQWLSRYLQFHMTWLWQAPVSQGDFTSWEREGIVHCTVLIQAVKQPSPPGEEEAGVPVVTFTTST